MKFKTVLTIFTLLIVATIVSLGYYIQSKKFGEKLTSLANAEISKFDDLNLKIESLNIAFFPPGIEINNLQVKKEINGGEVTVNAGKIGLYTGVINLEESIYSLGEVRISDALVDIETSENSDQPLEEIDEILINEIFNYQKKLPIIVSNILLENIFLKINQADIDIKRLRLVKEDDFLLRFSLAHVSPNRNENISLDEIYGDIKIGRRDIQIKRMRINEDVHSIILKGSVENYPKLKNAKAEISGELGVFLAPLHNIIEIDELIKLRQGHANSSFSLVYDQEFREAKVDLSLNQVNSTIVNAENVNAELYINQEQIKLMSLSLRNRDERLKLLNQPVVYKIKEQTVLPEVIKASVDKLELNNALRILSSMDVLKGKLSGTLDFIYKNGDLKFRPNNGFIVDHLRLDVGNSEPFEIIHANQVILSNSFFDVINGEFVMDSQIKAKNSLLIVKGRVNSREVDFEAIDSIVDLEDLGNISQLDIKGSGKLNVLVKGPLNDVGININGETNAFEVLGYKLGHTNLDLTVMLESSDVLIHNMISKYKSTPLQGSGFINYDDMSIGLDITSLKSNYHDLKEILHPILGDIDFFPKDLDFMTKIKTKISGKTNLDELVVNADIDFQDLYAYGESLSQGKIDLTFKNQVLKLDKLDSLKGLGRVGGYFQFDLARDELFLNYKWKDISISSFNIFKNLGLSLNGELSGEIVGGGKISDYNLNLKSIVDKKKVGTFKYEPTQFEMKITPNSYSGSAYFFGEKISSELDINLGKKDRSSFTLNTQIDDLKPIAIAILGNHLESEQFQGRLGMSLKANFSNDLRFVDFEGHAKELFFDHENFKLDYQSDTSQFIVKDSVIKKWELFIDQPDFTVDSKGHGKFSEMVNIYHHTDINSKILEVLVPSVLSADGFINSKTTISGKLDDYDLRISSGADALNLTIDYLPMPLNKMTYRFDLKDRRILIDHFSANLESGNITAYGDVFFDDAYPDINVKYKIDKAEVPVLVRSVINLSGEGIVVGNNPPYNVGGEIQINKAQIVNELSDFSAKTNAMSQIRFLPEDQDSLLSKWFNLNLNVSSVTPIKVTNSLMDLSLTGEMVLTGNPLRPRGEGNMTAPANSSRVYFKNNEYLIQKADLAFNPKRDISNPDFDIHAVTNISSYRVDAKAYGNLERFNFDLTSDPVLTRNSILSLIAFGYSDEIQSTLTQDQQQNLTQVGVGSFVFDRFKISDILNKQFGLQVNLGTVFEQSQTQSLLSGRSQDGQGMVGRTRTATKIELKKRLDESLNLSVSSTMGGSIGQRQSMNLNYSINSKVQLEGVYELRTNDEGQEDVIDNSIGGDLKFRWTFK